MTGLTNVGGKETLNSIQMQLSVMLGEEWAQLLLEMSGDQLLTDAHVDIFMLPSAFAYWAANWRTFPREALSDQLWITKKHPNIFI